MKFRRIIIVIAVAALMFPVLVQAQGPGGKGPGVESGKGGKGGSSGGLGMPRGAWWERQSVVKYLKLNEEQQKKLQTIALAHRKEMIMLRAELEIKEVDLDPLLAADKLDEKRIKSVIDEIEIMRAKISKSRMNMLLEVRKVLTRDQYVKLKQYKGLRRRRIKRVGGQGRGQRPGGRAGERGVPGARGDAGGGFGPGANFRGPGRRLQGPTAGL